MSRPLLFSVQVVRSNFLTSSRTTKTSQSLLSRNFTQRGAARAPQSRLRSTPSSLHELAAEHQNAAQEIEHSKRKRNYMAAGLVLSVAATWTIIFGSGLGSKPGKDKLDSGDRAFPSGSAPNQEDEKLRSLRQTGTSSVPFFPKNLTLQSDRSVSTATPALPAGVSLPGTPTASSNDDFTLLGLGIRTVSFLSIQVYVVGLYIATPDLHKLQAAMVKAGADVETASTLVTTEKKQLKERLLDPEQSLAIWDGVLKEAGIRSAVRVVPTRGTDYAHLRDGWVRGIMARSGNANTGYNGEKFDDDAFGEAIGEFKKMFGNKKLPKGKVLILERESDGKLIGWEQAGTDKEYAKMGEIRDERLGRLIWEVYLAGKNVSSEGAKKDIVEGVLELVERPLGTVETQVV